MLIIGINATDALPAYDNLYYHVLHSIWVADSKIDGTSKHFSKKCARAREAVLEKVSDALYDKEEFPPFGKPYLWKDIENTIFKIKESSSINHRLINNHFYFNYKKGLQPSIAFSCRTKIPLQKYSQGIKPTSNSRYSSISKAMQSGSRKSFLVCTNNPPFAYWLDRRTRSSNSLWHEFMG